MDKSHDCPKPRPSYLSFPAQVRKLQDTPMAQVFTFLKLLVLFLPFSLALKFDLAAHTGHNRYERCIRNFVAKDTLVLVTAIVGGTKGDGQQVNMHVGFKAFRKGGAKASVC